MEMVLPLEEFKRLCEEIKEHRSAEPAAKDSSYTIVDATLESLGTSLIITGAKKPR